MLCCTLVQANHSHTVLFVAWTTTICVEFIHKCTSSAVEVHFISVISVLQRLHYSNELPGHTLTHSLCINKHTACLLRFCAYRIEAAMSVAH